MSKCLMGISTKHGRFEFWYCGPGNWRDEVEYEDVEIIDMFIRRQMVRAVKRKQERRAYDIAAKLFASRQFQTITCG